MKKKVIYAAMALALVATGALVATTGRDTARADEMKNVSTISATADKSLISNLMDETVYVFLDADGKVKKTISSDWSKNDLGADVYTKTEGKVTTPVTVGITYYLDGKEVSAEEIRGRSGHFKIRYDFTNNEVVNGMYVPYAVLTGVVLPNDHFVNVAVTNGKLVNDGGRLMIAGIALPGMKENLGVGINLPEYVEIEGEAKDFKMEMTATLATAQIFADIDTSALNSVAALSSQLDTLASSMLQLMNGSVQLRDGLATLNSKTGVLASGAQALRAGSMQLVAGANKLSEGLGTLYTGSKDLAKGLTDAYNGSKALAAGTSDASSVAQKIDAGVAELTKELGALINGMSSLSPKAAEMSTSATALKTQTITSLSGRLAEYLSSYDLPEITANNYKEVLGRLINYLRDSGDEQALVQELSLALGNLQIYDGVISCVATLSEMNKKATAAPEKITSLKEGTSKLSEGLTKINQNMSALSNGLSRLSGGATKLSEGLSGAYTGSKELATGMTSLDAGISNLSSNVPALTEGVSKLYSGSASLSEGLSQFNSEGVQRLVALYNGNIKALIDRIQMMVNLAKKSAKVKYIYKTEEI